LGADAQGVEVIKTDSLDPARLLYQLGMRIYAVSRWHGPIKQSINFPDNKVPWMPFAYNAGRRMEFDYILATAPPFSTFITGYYLAECTGKPLIVDFRDAWLEFPFMPYRGYFQKGFVRHWETKVVGTAKRIVVVDDNIKKSLLRKYPEIQEKICVIPNGYDPDDFTQKERPDIFTISYLGTIRGERNPENVLCAVEQFRNEQQLGNRDIRFRFIGHIEEYFHRNIKNYGFVETTGHLSYKKAISTFCSSHLAVLITTGSEYFFPSRQNEYLASGLPIIVCGKSKGLHLLDGAFEKGYPGWMFEYDGIHGMKKKIAELYHKYKRGFVLKGKTPYTEYTREKLTHKLAGLISEI
jgi:glycosyltransferase involved in cell wall biosynthesis